MGELKRNKNKERIGKIYCNKEGYNAICIKYNDRNDIYIQFLDKYKCVIHTKWTNFKNGNFHNPYAITLYNKGYIGNVNTTGKNYTAYKVWADMLRRCYTTKYSTYKNCRVCDEWLCFEHFLKWFNENYYEIENETINLDKDILYKNNKIYSPQTCIFVPQSINKLLIKSNKSRGTLPIGVRKMGNKYQARCSINNKAKVLGIFNTIAEAFLCYKTFKENYIKEYINIYKYKIPINVYNQLYNAIYNYKVEITD